MNITERDRKLFLKLNQASWLSTSQLLKCFFQDKSANAVNKRMRKLVNAGYLFCSRNSSMEEYLYRLKTKAKQYLLDHTSMKEGNIVIPKRLPQNLQHFLGINDIRLYFEKSIEKAQGEILLFASDRDLKSIYPQAPLIPDALVRFRYCSNGENQIYNFTIEYDNETENPQYFGSTKVKKYMESINRKQAVFGLTQYKVLVFADNMKRLISLMRHSIKYLSNPGVFQFCLITDLMPSLFITKPVFLDPFDFYEVEHDDGKMRIFEKPFKEGDTLKFHSLL